MIYYNLFTPRAKMNALGALGLVGTIANAGFQDYTNRKNREFSQEMLQEQQRFQRELNANSALVQKQSLQSAGLSPNMLSGDPPYGSSSALGDSSSQQAPQLDVNSIVALAQMEQQKPLVKAQADLAQAEAKETLSRIPKNEADTGKTIQETANLAQQYGLLEFENQVQKQKFDVFMQRQFADIDKTEAETSNVNIDTKVKDLEAQLDEASLEDRKKIYTQTLYEIMSRKNLNYALRKQAFANANKAYAEASFTKAQEHRLRKLLEVEWYRLDQEGKKLGFDMDFVIAQTASVVTKQDWIDFENEMKAFGMGANLLVKLLKFTPYGRKR